MSEARAHTTCAKTLLPWPVVPNQNLSDGGRFSGPTTAEGLPGEMTGARSPITTNEITTGTPNAAFLLEQGADWATRTPVDAGIVMLAVTIANSRSSADAVPDEVEHSGRA